MFKLLTFHRRVLLRGINVYEVLPSCSYSTATEHAVQNVMKPVVSRTHSNDPDTFTLNNEAQWYTIPDSSVQRVFTGDVMTLNYRQQHETLGECSLMIRRPFLDVVNCLKQTNYDLAVNRYVLYGKSGHGKTMTLLQTAYYANLHGWIVCMVPRTIKWGKIVREIAMSTSRPGRIDLPLDASEWLKIFRVINAELIDQYKLTTTQTYNWSEWESTAEGESLLNVIDMGINRIKFSSDCVGVLCKELKMAANNKQAKVLVCVDSVNNLLGQTRIKREDKTLVAAKDVSLLHAFRKMMVSSWRNGAVVSAVDMIVEGRKNFPDYKPVWLLKDEGFDLFDPFVPIHVPIYTGKEIESVLDYYTAVNWIQNEKAKTPTGREQLKHLSGFNPHNLERLIATA